MDKDILIPAMLIIAGVFFTICSVMFSVRYLKIKNTLLSGLFFINAFLPISYVGFSILQSQKNVSMVTVIIPAAVILICIVDLIVIFILPLLSHRKIAKDIENKILFSVWCLSLLVFFGFSFFFLLIVFMFSGF